MLKWDGLLVYSHWHSERAAPRRACKLLSLISLHLCLVSLSSLVSLLFVSHLVWRLTLVFGLGRVWCEWLHYKWQMSSHLWCVVLKSRQGRCVLYVKSRLSLLSDIWHLSTRSHICETNHKHKHTIIQIIKCTRDGPILIMLGSNCENVHIF